MAITTPYANTLLTQILCRELASPTRECYFGVSTTTPNADGSNFTEPLHNTGYARIKIGSTASSSYWLMSEPANGVSCNTTSLTFNPSTAQWGNITHFGIFHSEASGLPVYVGAFTSPLAIPAGYIANIPVGALQLSIQ